jgi:asparagine synthase (glutamine-hydrolysing)
MCGVCGVIRPGGTLPADRAAVQALNRRQQHRGPDDSFIWCDEGGALGQTRLAIIDLTDGGRQPFVSADGTACVVFNGEIYNHDELRSRYRLGTPSRCDGAILPELWQRLGTSMFAQLRGMFAIAVYDRRGKSVTLARDPFGIKPLYWTLAAEGVLAFASEPRSLLHLAPRQQISRAALRRYLMFGALGRDQSPFQDVEAVPANGWVQWDRAMTRRSGVIKTGLFDPPYQIRLADLRPAFFQSVSAHLSSDVPMALLLSSGLDSAAIAWAGGQLGARLTCVTVDMGAGMSERTGAARVAARFGHTHQVVTTRPDPSLVQRFFEAMQRPSIDGLKTFLVSSVVAGLGVKVALSSLGGDEVLGGYPSFRLLRLGDGLSLTALLAHLSGGRNQKLAFLLDPTGPRDAAGLATLVRRVLLDEQIGRLAPALISTDRVRRTGYDRSSRALSMAELTGYLGGTLLPDADAFSMSWSVEMRVPYVDVPFARIALGVAEQRVVGKRRFASALGDPELRAIARRPKRGFTLPMDQWMRHGPLTPWVEGARQRDAPVRGLLSAGAVDEVLAAWRVGELSWSRAWLVVSLDAWLRTLGPDVSTPAVGQEAPASVGAKGWWD